MGQVSVQWINNKTFIGIDSTNHSVVLSSPVDGIGMKPSDLLFVALASCTAVDVINIMSKKKTPLTSLEIKVNGEQDADPPWTYRNIHMIFLVKGKNLTEKNLNQAIQLSEEKYCSVGATISGMANITWEYQIIPEDE